MKSVYIFHDAYSNPQSEWIPWMRIELEKQGYAVIIPRFPIGQGQTLASWEQVVQPFIKKFDHETVVLGHGLGATLALHLLSRITTKIARAVFVAPVIRSLEHKGYQMVAETFFQKKFDIEHIMQYVSDCIIMHGTDDPFIPVVHAQELGNMLHVSPHIIQDGGHLNTASGYDRFTVLLDAVIQPLPTPRSPFEKSENQPSLVVPTLPQKNDIENIDEWAMHPEQNVPHANIIKEQSTDVVESPAHIKQQAIRTFQKDSAKITGTFSGTVMSELLEKARTQEQEKKVQSPKSGKNIAFILGAIVCIIGGLVATIFALSYTRQALIVPIVTVPSLIRAESHYKIDITLAERFVLVNDINKQLNVTASKINHLYYVIQNQDGLIRASFDSVLSRLGLTNQFAGINNDSFMHGVFVYEQTIPIPFLLLQTNDFDDTFDSLRRWEPLIIRDIGALFAIPVAEQNLAGTFSFVNEVSYNTPIRIARFKNPSVITLEDEVEKIESPQSDGREGEPIQDLSDTKTDGEIIENREPEIITTIIERPLSGKYQENDPLLFYTFLNERTLIIATDPRILPEIAKRRSEIQLLR